MDVDASAPPSQSYTILRIKRKRNEEPLDALVVESRVRRKKSRGGVGVFQYAHTVEDNAWKDEKSQKDIKDRISRLAKEDVAKPQSETTMPESELPSSPKRLKKAQTPRYTIVSTDEQGPPTKRRTATPPQTSSSAVLPKNPPFPDFRMYDAIPSGGKSIQAGETDPEMEKFLPLLKDYLKIHDISSNSLISSDAATPKVRSGSPVGDESDDYVWDVFYHRPVTLSEWNSVAARTGTLTGLPLSVLDSDESGSDSEAEDEADEDSNAEEYYKNDYPDEETDSEPNHSGSDYDDVVHYRDDGEDF